MCNKVDVKPFKVGDAVVRQVGGLQVYFVIQEMDPIKDSDGNIIDGVRLFTVGNPFINLDNIPLRLFDMFTQDEMDIYASRIMFIGSAIPNKKMDYPEKGNYYVGQEIFVKRYKDTEGIYKAAIINIKAGEFRSGNIYSVLYVDGCMKGKTGEVCFVDILDHEQAAPNKDIAPESTQKEVVENKEENTDEVGVSLECINTMTKDLIKSTKVIGSKLRQLTKEMNYKQAVLDALQSGEYIIHTNIEIINCEDEEKKIIPVDAEIGAKTAVFKLMESTKKDMEQIAYKMHECKTQLKQIQSSFDEVNKSLQVTNICESDN